VNIAVMGAGGLGGFIGGVLARKGLEISFLARGQHLEAILRSGLRVESPSGNFTIKPANATADPSEVGVVDLILFCVKSYDVLEAIEMMKPMLGSQTLILPVLNGVEHIDQMRDHLGADHVLGGLAMIGSNIAEPGLVRHYALNSLEFGEIEGGISDRCMNIQQALANDIIDIEAVANVLERMWWKFASICGAGVFTVMRGKKELVWDFPETRDLIRSALNEVVAVAHAKGIALPSSVVDEMLAVAEGMPPHYKPSTLVDLEKGNRLEIEALNGALSRYGRQVGVATPVNDFIYACLKPHTSGSRDS
jgi:2-dehydropantoate 2-reductase